MVKDIDPRVIGITESWANKDIGDVELRLMFHSYNTKVENGEVGQIRENNESNIK